MTKKFKIKDLEVEPDVDSRTRHDYTKINLDDLTEDESAVITPQPTAPPPIFEEPPITKTEVQPKITNEAKENVTIKVIEASKEQFTFKRNLFHAYFFKVLGFATALLVLDLAGHFLKFFEEIDVLKMENFKSMFYGTDPKWNIIKLVSFLVGAYLLTSDEKLVVKKTGIECRRFETMMIFFTSTKVVLSWEDIVFVKYKVSLFEPYLFFYGVNNEELGRIDFALDSREDFFRFIEKYAGKNHPLYKIKGHIASL